MKYVIKIKQSIYTKEHNLKCDDQIVTNNLIKEPELKTRYVCSVWMTS